MTLSLVLTAASVPSEGKPGKGGAFVRPVSHSVLRPDEYRYSAKILRKSVHKGYKVFTGLILS